MSPLRRRSSRIRGSKNTPYKRNEPAMSLLATVGEQEGTPCRADNSTFNAVESSPQAPNTPHTVGRIRPPPEEMHPSKVHQSTKKESENSTLGFSDIGARKPAVLTTPSKLKIDASAEFEFRFSNPAPSLGPEAQQMMDEIRGDARRIKAELAAKREEEIAKNGGDMLGVLSGRKIAQPKGKASRYSEVHMAEFKKMDSIAAHPSAFRAQPGRITTAPKTLKRTQSKANLADREPSTAKQTIKLVRQSTCPDNDALSKRARQIDARDTSFARPSSRDATSEVPSKPSTPTTNRTSNFLASITTPTQSSITRTAGIKPEGPLPSSMRRSPSKIALTPGLVKSATMNNLGSITRSNSTHRFTDKMKSILRRPTTDNLMPPPQGSIPSLIKSPSRPNLNKEVPPAPATPTTKQLTRSKSTKHVNFTPSATEKIGPQHSPTPLKSNIPRSKSFANLNSVSYPALSPVPKPAMRPVEMQAESIVEAKSTVTYPTLPKLPETPSTTRTPLQVQPQPVPGIFTFTSGQTIKFGTPPTRTLGTSLGQTSIRKVRPSILSATMPGSFPDGDKENEAPVIPHGLANKKRARAASPCDEASGEQLERSPKKHKGNAAEGQMLMAPKLLAEQMAPKSKIPSPAKKGGLSLSRLKMLATPKSRR